MKKLFFGIAMMLAATTAVTSFAAGAATPQADKQQTICPNDSCPRKEKKCRKQRSECRNLQNCRQQNCDPKNCRQQNCDPQNCPQQNCDPQNCPQQNCRKKSDKKEFSKDGRHGRKGDKRYASAGRHGKKDMRGKKQNLFEGITLTDSQQKEISDLRAKTKEERKAVKAEMRKEKENVKNMTAEQKAAARTKMAEAKKAAREAYDKAIGKILTPEQYAKYQENVKAAQVKKAEKKAKKESAKAGSRKDGRKGGAKDGARSQNA